MDFNNKLYYAIPLFGDVSICINDTLISTWVVGFALIILSLVVRFRLNNFTDKPFGFQNLVEFLVEAMDNFVVSILGEKYAFYGNWFFGVFAFILLGNLSGLFGLRPPTADLATTFAFGITTFFLIHFTGIKTQKSRYFRGYFSPMFLFLPINLIGEISAPISLSFRLFGNLLGGLIIMELIYGLIPWFLVILGIPAALHGYFDIFAGVLQAFIFVVLSMTFIRNKTPD